MTDSIDDGNHPRLFLDQDGIGRLRQSIRSGTPGWLYERLINQCDLHVASVDLDDARWSGPVGEKGGRSGFWKNPREILDTSLGYALSGDERYRNLALNMIDRMIGWGTWFHRYEPDRGVMLQSLAIAYDLMHPALGDERARTLRQMIAAECRDMLPYLRSGGQRHKHSHNTAAARTFSAFGVAVMSILPLDRSGAVAEAVAEADAGGDDIPSEWMELARDGVAGWIEAGLDEEGGTRYATEGSYNLSAVGHVVAFAIAYRKAFGRDPCDLDRLRKYILFSLYKLEPQRDGIGQFGTGGRVGSYAPDTILGLMNLFDDGLARWMYDVYYGPDADLERFYLDGVNISCSEGCYVFPLLFWKELEAEAPDTSPRLARAALFRGSGKAVMRTGFESRDDLQLVIQCPSPQHGHSFADVGNFTLNALGERFIDDSGCAGGNPELHPGTWGSYPWACSSGAHNLVLIDGVAQHTHSFGTIPDFLHTEAADYLMAEMKPAYDARAPVRRARRHVLFVRPSYFAIIDDVCKDDRAHDYELLLHGEWHRPLEQIDRPNQFVWSHERADLLVAFAHPGDVELSPSTAEKVTRQSVEGDHKDWSLWPGVLEKKNPLRKSRLEMPDHQAFLERMGDAAGVPPFYSFSSGEPRDEGLFFTLLYPMGKGSPVPEAIPISGEGVAGMAVDGRDTVAFNRTDGPVETNDGTTDARVFHTRVEDGRLIQWLAAGATTFSHSGHGFVATEAVTVCLRGSEGSITASRETALAIEFPSIEGVELDGVPIHITALRQNGLTVRVPAGNHRLRIVTNREDAHFRERE